MKTELDFENIQRIIEKIERWEALDENEQAIARIILALKKEKWREVVLDQDFQRVLRQQLLAKYDVLYSRAPWYQKILSLWQMPVFKVVVSFCFVLVIVSSIYGSLIPKTTHTGIQFGGRYESVSNSLPTSESKDMSDSVKKSESSYENMEPGRNRGWSMDFGAPNVLSKIQGSAASSDSSGILTFIWNHRIGLGFSIFLIIGIIGFIFIRRKK